MAAPSVDSIPRIPGFPIIGSGLSMLRDPIGFLVEKYHEVGPVFRVNAGVREVTVLAGPEANLMLMQSGEQYFRLNPIYGTLNKETASDIYLPTLDEPDYGYYRRLIKPKLSRDALAPHLPSAVAMVERLVCSWKPGEQVRVMEMTYRLVLEMVGLSTENTAVGEHLDDIIFFTNRLIGSGVAFQPGFLLKLPDYQRAKRRFEQFLAAIVEAHCSKSPGENRTPDYVDLLLEASTKDGKPLEGHDLLAYVHLPFVNGVAYSPRISAYMLYELLRHPNLLQQVRDEVDAAFDGGLDMAALRRMRWMHGVYMETLRMYPIAGALPRYVAQSFEFGGHTIEAGQLVFIATGVCHFLPQFYPDPYTFDPLRYSEPRNEHHQPGAFAAFGLGQRTCLSAGLGDAIIMTLIATLLRNVELELSPRDYTMKSVVAPIPGPEKRFSVRVIGQRSVGALL
jgi:cytochrome P450